MNSPARELGITPAESAKVKAIMMAERPKFIAVQDSKTLTPQQKSQKIGALRAQVLSKCMAVLTPLQRKKVMAMHMHGNMMRPGAR